MGVVYKPTKSILIALAEEELELLMLGVAVNAKS